MFSKSGIHNNNIATSIANSNIVESDFSPASLHIKETMLVNKHIPHTLNNSGSIETEFEMFLSIPFNVSIIGVMEDTINMPIIITVSIDINDANLLSRVFNIQVSDSPITVIPTIFKTSINLNRIPFVLWL